MDTTTEIQLENELGWTWTDMSGQLFEKFDVLKTKYSATDREIINAVNMGVGFDIADEYENWIVESDT